MFQYRLLRVCLREFLWPPKRGRTDLNRDHLDYQNQVLRLPLDPCTVSREGGIHSSPIARRYAGVGTWTGRRLGGLEHWLIRN